MSISLWGSLWEANGINMLWLFLNWGTRRVLCSLSVPVHMQQKKTACKTLVWEPRPLLNQALYLASSHLAFKKFRLHTKRKRTVVEANASCFISAPSSTLKGPAAGLGQIPLWSTWFNWVTQVLSAQVNEDGWQLPPSGSICHGAHTAESMVGTNRSHCPWNRPAYKTGISSE